MSASAVVCSYRIALPSDVAELYDQQAAAQNVPVEELISRRARESVRHTSSKPLYISDEQRIELESVLGRNFHRPKDLLEAVRRMAEVRVENVKVLLTPEVLERLKSRHFSDLPFDAWLSQQVREWAERAAEMR